MSGIRITQGDNYPTFRINVYHNNTAVDLTGASVKFAIKHNVTGHIYTEVCNVANNIASFKFTSNSTCESGVYKGNLLATFPNGDTISIPNDEYIPVVIKAPTNEVGAVGESTTEYMKTTIYDQDTDGIVDKAEKLHYGLLGKTYQDINLEIDTDIETHRASATAHHSNVNDPTADQKAALNASTNPSGTNKYITQNDTTVFGNMFKTTYDTNDDGIVDVAASAPWSGITGKPSTYPATAHTHPTGEVVDLVELIEDTINSTIVAGNQLETSYNDTTGKLTISYQTTPLNEEAVQDIVGALVVAGTGISVTYNDAGVPPTLTIAISTHTHSIANVTGLQTALDSKFNSSDITHYFNKDTQTLDNITAGTTNVHFTDANRTKLAGVSTGADVTPADAFRKTVDDLDDITTGVTNVHFTSANKTKLDGIATGANNYSLPIATGSVLGGIKIGSRLTISNGVLSADVQPGSGDMLASVYDTGSDNTLNSVDTADKLKYNSSLKSYADISSEIDSDITTHTNNTSAHHTRYTDAEAVSAAKADSAVADSLTKRHSHTNSTILNGITNVGSGLIITAAERTKLNGIATSANNYVLPIATNLILGGVKVGNKFTITDGVLNAGSDIMLLSAYDTGSANTTNVVDTANALLDGASVKTYANIASKIDGDLSTHTNNTSAHHTRYTNSEAVAAAKADATIDDALTKRHAHTNSAVLNALTNAGSGLIITDAERTKLSGIATGANNYTLPAATASTLGGIIVGSGLSVTAGGTLSADGSGTGDMLIANYDTGNNNTTYSVDTSDKLKNGVSTPKSYSDIAAEIDSDISTHAGVATAHHTNVNDPTSSQKAALVGTAGVPGDSNRYVTNSDTRLTDARTPSTHLHTVAEVSDIATNYEPIISSKGTAFNKSFGTGADTVCAGDDSRLTDTRSPTAHATNHKIGGSDPVKLDELDSPTDTTNLNVSTTAHGLCPKLTNISTNFLRGDGTWANPPEMVLIETLVRWEEGLLTTNTSFMPHYAASACSINSIVGYIMVRPVGQNIKIDIRKNSPALESASIFTGNVPCEIATNQAESHGVYPFTFTASIDNAEKNLVIGDVLYFIIQQVGTEAATAGTGLYIKVIF